MQSHFYTNERNHQILISLLKANGIRYVVASPGTTNSVFIGSIQNDTFFRIYSAVDERSASYIANGLILRTGEPVIISCTGATAARNYMSGATEAYYSKLPLLIITSSQPSSRIGHLFPQVTDRTAPPRDVCKLSVEMPLVNNADDEWQCEVQCNRALLELKRHGGGPVHINLITSYRYSENTALTCKELPPVRIIRRYGINDTLPEMPQGKIAIFVGSHKVWPQNLKDTVERFCASNNAVVLADHPSNYNGRFKIPYALVINQSSINKANKPAYEVDLLIHIGEVTGEEGAPRMIKGKETWRVSPDGEIRDTFKNLTAIFEMNEYTFFDSYSKESTKNESYFNECNAVYKQLLEKRKVAQQIMPFSNTWVAGEVANAIPENSTVVLAILNTLRTWNYATFKTSVDVFCPLGGFGIDGATSIALGVSIADKEKLCFCITGDLAFFYDLNSLGNRSLPSNLRILLVNNGCGVEFKKTYAMAYRLLGDEVDEYVAAARHNGNKSVNLIKHFSEDLGFEYLTASNKVEFEKVYKKFVTSELMDRPMLFEVFVSADDECEALNVVHDRKKDKNENTDFRWDRSYGSLLGGFLGQ